METYDQVLRTVASKVNIPIRTVKLVLDSLFELIVVCAKDSDKVPLKIGSFKSRLDSKNKSIDIFFAVKNLALGKRLWNDSVFPELYKEKRMLIECPDCSKMVSNMAISCPDCGYPIKCKIDDGTIRASKKSISGDESTEKKPRLIQG